MSVMNDEPKVVRDAALLQLLADLRKLGVSKFEGLTPNANQDAMWQIKAEFFPVPEPDVKSTEREDPDTLPCGHPVFALMNGVCVECGATPEVKP